LMRCGGLKILRSAQDDMGGRTSLRMTWGKVSIRMAWGESFAQDDNVVGMRSDELRFFASLRMTMGMAFQFCFKQTQLLNELFYPACLTGYGNSKRKNHKKEQKYYTQEQSVGRNFDFKHLCHEKQRLWKYRHYNKAEACKKPYEGIF